MPKWIWIKSNLLWKRPSKPQSIPPKDPKKLGIKIPHGWIFLGYVPTGDWTPVSGFEVWRATDYSTGTKKFGPKNFSSSTSHFLLDEVYYEKFFLPKFLCPHGVVSCASDFKSRHCGSSFVIHNLNSNPITFVEHCAVLWNPQIFPQLILGEDWGLRLSAGLSSSQLASPLSTERIL